MQTATKQLIPMKEVVEQARKEATRSRNEQRAQLDRTLGEELRKLYAALKGVLSLDLDNEGYAYEKAAILPCARPSDGTRVGALVTVSDFRFALYIDEFSEGRFPALLGTCPSCGNETVSDSITTLETFGQLTETFVPAYSHRLECDRNVRNEQYTVSQDEYQLLQSLKKIIASESISYEV